jgi:hypothetical protein
MHPLTPDLTKLPDEELHKNHSNLQNKLTFAYRMGQSDMVGQLQLVLEDYAREVERRNLKAFDDASKNGRNYQDKIDITK